ncbi:MAG: hypothetical protein ACYT04_50440, partial [Nostoc sp.]
HITYIIAPSSLAGRGLGVGFFYLTKTDNRYNCVVYLSENSCNYYLFNNCASKFVINAEVVISFKKRNWSKHSTAKIKGY